MSPGVVVTYWCCARREGQQEKGLKPPIHGITHAIPDCKTHKVYTNRFRCQTHAFNTRDLQELDTGER